MAFVDSLEPRQLLAAVTPRYSPHGWAPFETDSVVDGKGRTILAAVYRTHGQVSVTRLKGDGSTDPTFGKNGFATLALGEPPAKYGTNAFQLLVDHAGKILVLQNKQLSRLTASGGVDTSFGKSGALTMPILSKAADVVVDAKDRPLVVGTSKGKTGDRATIVRLTARGAVDASFGSGGAYKTPVPRAPTVGAPGNAKGVTAKVFADGTIVGVATTATRVDNGGGDTRDFKALDAFRLTSNGQLDETYGTDGVTEVITSSSEYASRSVTFGGFNGDGGLTIRTRTIEELVSGTDDRTVLTRLDVDGHVGKVSNG